MALGKMKRHSKQFVPPKLHITSMMDMFTIILIFLLFSFSNKPETINIDKNLKLPESIAKLDRKESIKLVLSLTNLTLEDEVIASVKDGKIVGLDPHKLKESNIYQKLKVYREEEIESEDEGEARKHVIFLCDKRLSFKIINTVIKAAAMAGYPNFQFAVLKK
ncbi:MAG: biopolymer transporter ExbD [Thermodesulfobacteriota bacterium]|nr:biopolymer transporter ExbD [Thermodesulfobacteriota bacterium]